VMIRCCFLTLLCRLLHLGFFFSGGAFHFGSCDRFRSQFHFPWSTFRDLMTLDVISTSLCRRRRSFGRFCVAVACS
jgi:hypothetical protein